MIVSGMGATLRLVTQPDHARLAAELLALWRLPKLVDHPRRAGLLVAVREHDNGWREADAAPRVDPASGAPCSFLDAPDEVRREVWRRGSRRYAASDPYVALLITRHALELLGDRRGEEAWQPLLAELDERHDELCERCELAEVEVAADYRWLAVGDLLSLTACSGGPESRSRHEYRAQLVDATLHLAPFPLAGTTTFSIPCRRIPARRYRGDADLGGELAAARWQHFALRVAPFGQSRSNVTRSSTSSPDAASKRSDSGS
ncbi:MAG TPA: DUF3891 family protein [Thermoanaerobaculia bacterium]|nr:DUF3891 family protein [Thermoanaerobaculia bacterium]